MGNVAQTHTVTDIMQPCCTSLSNLEMTSYTRLMKESYVFMLSLGRPSAPLLLGKPKISSLTVTWGE